ncbi:DUF5719 family protein [Streptomyces sp. GC420]|uniref:DUF5719 family protein n=1 Tax=Streptomyces sp. GC420 TaxID=2697568 RepID=UPI001414DBE3|nr:DUF5719 family protein [Streptomyces sp. GC420]NBM19583.1 hypothetical protein [Streptomyces sp. GC420]
MNRTTISLLAVATALAAVTGVATVTAPDGAAESTTATAARRLPVERSTLVCPQAGNSDLAETTYTSITPRSEGSGGSAGKGAAELLPATQSLVAADDEDAKDGGAGAAGDKGRKPLLTVEEPGTPVTAEASGTEAPALIGSADGRLAPGWAAQQTTVVSAGDGRGLAGLACTAPDTDFWFPGASTAEGRQDYIHLTNPDDTAAVVDLELYDDEGAIKSDVAEGITVPAGSSVPVLLSTFTTEPSVNLTVHVTTRTGRVGASLRATDDQIGTDWLPASADPAGTLVMPGIPADAVSVRLIAFATGDDDADVQVRLAGRNGTITPAGNESLHIKSGMTAAVDLGNITQGEAGSLILSPEEGGAGGEQVVAALRVTRGKGPDQEVAFIPATAAVTDRATALDNRAKGSTLSLVALDRTVKVKVTASAGTGGGEPVSETYTVKAGTTTAVTPPVPDGLKGSYALTVEPEPGGEVHASRTLALPQDGVPMFTVQTLPDDKGMVAVPKARQDLSLLTQD